MQVQYEEKPTRTPLWRSRSVLISAACIGILIFVVTFRLLPKDSQVPEALTQLSKSVNYTLYYPTPLPTAYSYGSKPASLDRNVVIYFLTNGGQTITVSEQATPAAPPDLYHLVNFTPLSTPLGSAAIGASLGRPIAIILSSTTLITITGGQGTPIGSIRTAAENLQPF